MKLKPIIVFGFHNSGTSLLAEILSSLGVQMLVDMAHSESKLISLRLNNELMMDEHWHRLPILSTEELTEREGRFGAFLDEQLPKHLTELEIQPERPWGFKDPRISTLLPLYRNYFGNATYIQIQRNVDSVADSLSQKDKLDAPSGSLSKEHYRKLWEENIERINSIAGTLENYYLIEYEKLCKDPTEEISKLADFLDLGNDETISKAASTVRRNASE